jgi:hypothetical protein
MVQPRCLLSGSASILCFGSLLRILLFTTEERGRQFNKAVSTGQSHVVPRGRCIRDVTRRFNVLIRSALMSLMTNTEAVSGLTFFCIMELRDCVCFQVRLRPRPPSPFGAILT